VAGAGHFADLNGDGYQDALQFFPAAPLIGIDNPQWRYSLRSGTVSSALQVDFPASDATDNLQRFANGCMATGGPQALSQAWLGPHPALSRRERGNRGAVGQGAPVRYRAS
jgi:hypothetical protein